MIDKNVEWHCSPSIPHLHKLPSSLTSEEYNYGMGAQYLHMVGTEGKHSLRKI